MLSNEIVVDESEHRCGFVLLNEWRFVADHYFMDRESAEKFVKELQKQMEKVWPIDGY